MSLEIIKDMFGMNGREESTRGLIIWLKDSREKGRLDAMRGALQQFTTSYPCIACVGGIMPQIHSADTPDDDIIGAGLLLFGERDQLRVRSGNFVESLTSLESKRLIGKVIQNNDTITLQNKKSI